MTAGLKNIFKCDHTVAAFEYYVFRNKRQDIHHTVRCEIVRRVRQQPRITNFNFQFIFIVNYIILHANIGASGYFQCQQKKTFSIPND